MSNKYWEAFVLKKDLKELSTQDKESLYDELEKAFQTILVKYKIADGYQLDPIIHAIRQEK